MYSPKISAEHIPSLYRLARSRGISMTALINEAVRELLAQTEVQAAIAAVTIPPKATRAQPATSSRSTRQHTR
jgi:hypothetical protein